MKMTMKVKRFRMSMHNAGSAGLALVFIFCCSVVAAVTIKDSTTTAHTNNYSVGADYGLTSVQANTRVTRTFNCKVGRD